MKKREKLILSGKKYAVQGIDKKGKLSGQTVAFLSI